MVLCAVTLAGLVREINNTTDRNKKTQTESIFMQASSCCFGAAIVIVILGLHNQNMPLYGSVQAGNLYDKWHIFTNVA